MGRPSFALTIVGAGTAEDYSFVKEKIDHFIEGIRDRYAFIIISDGASGADKFLRRYALENGFLLKEMPAAKDRQHGSTGYIQSREIHCYAAGFEHRGCIAFWDGRSCGILPSKKMADLYKTPFRLVRCGAGAK